MHDNEWIEAACDHCGRLLGYYKQDWTDGAGVTEVVCPKCYNKQYPSQK